MKKKDKGKSAQIIFIGTGGQGVLFAGELLAKAGMDVYRYVSWYPNYGTWVRGGTSECTVILSDNEIASPIISHSDMIVLFDPLALETGLKRIKREGKFVAESKNLKAEMVKGEDIKPFLIPAVEMAVNLGDARAANMILLGASIEIGQTMPGSVVEAELERRLDLKREELLRNRRAFQLGIQIGSSLIREEEDDL